MAAGSDAIGQDWERWIGVELGRKAIRSQDGVAANVRSEVSRQWMQRGNLYQPRPASLYRIGDAWSLSNLKVGDSIEASIQYTLTERPATVP